MTQSLVVRRKTIVAHSCHSFTRKKNAVFIFLGGGAVYFLKCEQALRIDPEVAKEDVYCETDPH